MPDVRGLTGQSFHEYQIGEDIGEGADGIVYAGTCGEDCVAIKFFFPDVLKRNGVDEGMRRLDLQLQLRGSKVHPNLVQIFDGGYSEELETLFVVMELIPGKSLDKIISDVPRSAIPGLVRQLASAAEVLTSYDLVHRDIKPANIVVSDDYTHLTLLDLGVVLTIPSIDDPRISGEKFVATTRYSPPEFVWRTEESDDSEAWNAITFYQIGATLHDLIMKEPLYTGIDQPPAKLFDSVKLHTPIIEATDCEPWIVALSKCCLVKNWRERLELVNWESFKGPIETQTELEYQQKAIRLKLILKQEKHAMEKAQAAVPPANDRVNQLWQLQLSVFKEIRQYLLSSNIFPSRFGAHESSLSESSYQTKYSFEPHLTAGGFDEPLTITVELSINQEFEQATTMSILATTESRPDLFEAKWNEMLTVESTVRLIQTCLLQVADQMLSD
ncbi:hypothetical protein CSQ91_21100 [Janthinobacterium sp. BJB301]|nr:hypothetical protein CSQ91_21100 [Janthinobacterium sp. BJB301]